MDYCHPLIIKVSTRHSSCHYLYYTTIVTVDDKKRRYAEKMANAHLRSAGIGEYTPKGNSTFTKIQQSGSSEAGPSSRWRRRSSNEDDDFDF